MTLIENWKHIALHAWSSRLAWLAAACSIAEVVLPTLNGLVPPGTLAILSVIVAAASAISRLVAQPKLTAANDTKSA